MRPLTIVAAFALVLAGCANVEADAKSATPTAVPVRTAIVTVRSLTPRILATGVLGGKEEVPLSFKIGGIVARVLVDGGERVRAGQLLAELAPAEIQSEVGKAQQGRAKAQRDLARARALHADSVATLEQLQDATTAFEIAEENVRIAEFNRRYAAIRAPANGVVLRRLAEPGQFVTPGSDVLTVRTDGRGVVLRAGLPDRDVVRLRSGDSTTVRFDAYPGEAFRGRVSQIASASSPTSGTYDVEIALDAKAARLASGLIGRAEIAARGSAEYPVVPIDALLEAEGDSAIVYVLAPAGDRAVRRRVRIAQLDGALVAIASGVSSGDQVIVRGGAYVDDGTRVKVSAALVAAKEDR
jgi:multidrug efflux system membrane fusion protein